MIKKGHVLIVDDDQDVLFTAKTILKKQYEKISTESSPNRLESLLRKESIDIILLDMNFKAGSTSGNEGLFWLKKILSIDSDIQVVMNTAYGDINLAVESMKQGAVDFLVKPWEKEKLITTVNKVFEIQQSKKKIRKLEGKEDALKKDLDSPYAELVFQSVAMQKIMQTVERVAPTDASVLILGENGTGKEMVARAIHNLSSRSEESLIKIDLGAIAPTLFESELFGHLKGSFTDAKADRIGRLEIAEGGTLFLDEIGNLSIPLQVKLLSVLQNQMFTPVGGSKPIPFNARVVSATNQPLYEMIEEGKFRQDLLYRINTVEIELPPLRERMEDLFPLVQHYLRIYGLKYQKEGMFMEEKQVKALTKYPWPGNIRELQHAVERAVIMSSSSEVKATDFLVPQKRSKIPVSSLRVEDVERSAILKAIEKYEGNLSKAAAELGIGRTTLYRKIKKYKP